MIALVQLLAGRAPEPALSREQWGALLGAADRTLSATLLSGSPHVPEWFAEEVAARVAKNAVRRRRLLDAYREAATALERAGIEFVLLKGFTHETGFGIHPALRAQTDLDLLLRPPDVAPARDVLIAIGYTPHDGGELSQDHVAPLFKPAGWTWSGDYYDPAFPAVIELHHSPWSEARDRIALAGVDEFWARRVRMETAGLTVPAFDEVDRLAFAALHLLRHVLRNDARPAHAFELASALRLRSADETFWDRRRRLHPARLRQLQTIAFRFVTEWFGQTLPAALSEEWAAMPAGIREWFRGYAWSPIRNLTEPNKDVLWLHLALLPRFTDRVAVARGRLFPMHVPRRGEAWQRARYHAVALARAIVTAARFPTLRKAPTGNAPR